METLGKLDKAALALHAGAIVGVLADDDQSVRYAAVVTLGKMDQVGLTPHAIVTLLMDSNIWVRETDLML